jgi:hypothetical protein
MNTIQFKTILITNTATQAVIQSLPFNADNEKKAHSYSRQQNIMHPHGGLLSVKYVK